MRGSTDDEIRSKLGLERVNSKPAATVSPQFRDQPSVSKASGNSHGANSEPSEIYVWPPWFYLDTCTDNWYVQFKWALEAELDVIDVPVATAPNHQNIGGLEAFSLAFDGPVTNLGGTLTNSDLEYTTTGGPGAVWPNYYPNTYSPVNYWENNERGVSWKFQDKGYNWVMPRSNPCSPTNCPCTSVGGCETFGANSAGGSGVFTFKNKVGYPCLQAFAQIAHTWSGSQITSLTITQNGIEVTFSNVERAWKRTSEAGQQCPPQ